MASVRYNFRVARDPAGRGEVGAIAVTLGGEYWIDQRGVRRVPAGIRKGAGSMYTFTDEQAAGSVAISFPALMDDEGWICVVIARAEGTWFAPPAGESFGRTRARALAAMKASPHPILQLQLYGVPSGS